MQRVFSRAPRGRGRFESRPAGCDLMTVEGHRASLDLAQNRCGDDKALSDGPREAICSDTEWLSLTGEPTVDAMYQKVFRDVWAWQ